MPSMIVYYAHPGHRHSTVNSVMQARLDPLTDLTRVDLYHDYPRHNINIITEQNRLLEHDIVVFQFPFFWYSTPSILKEWLDLVLEYGFAYGPGGDKLAGKTLLVATTTGGSEEDYGVTGKHQTGIRGLLSPLECTARLCQMRFADPYILFNALSSDNASEKSAHAESYSKLIAALQDGTLKADQIMSNKTLSWKDVNQLMEAK